MLFAQLLLVLAPVIAKAEIAAFWGLGDDQTENSLYYHCRATKANTIFLENVFFNPRFGISFKGHCWDTFPESQTPRCRQLERDIIDCQKLGKKIYLGISGPAMKKDPFDDSGHSYASFYAGILNSVFDPNGQPDVLRPFGKAKIDGFYLDSHMTLDPISVNLALEMKKLNSKLKIGFEIGCEEYADPFAKKSFDFAIVNFDSSDHHCSIDKKFTWQESTALIRKRNAECKVYAGVAGSPKDSHYVDLDSIKEQLPKVIHDETFAGFAVRSAASAKANNDFIKQIVDLL